MLNERDGGIGGAPIIVEECETGYDTKKGVECYNSVKSRNPLIINPYSTGITLQLIPKAAVDKIPVLSMAYGLSASADGNLSPWIFNPPATYWDGASAFVRYAASVEGGLDKLKGKTIGLVHLDAPYGKEPIPLLQALAADYGFTLKLYPVPGSQMQNQTSLWLDVRRDRPDWIYLQGWGAMNPTALKEAAKVGFPMNRLIGNWWAGGDDDARAAGEAAEGYASLAISGVGQTIRRYRTSSKYVSKRLRAKCRRGTRLARILNRGVMNGVIVAEAIRAAQQLSGKKLVTGEDVRRGMETLNLTDARWKELGFQTLPGRSIELCRPQRAHRHLSGPVDGTKWTKSSDWIQPIKEKVLPLIDSAAEDYVKANAGWPKRTEACDKSS